MKLSAAFLKVLAFSMLFAVNCSYALLSSNPVSNSDVDGFARFTKVEFPLSKVDSLRIFYLEFSTNLAREPGIFGAFWHMPALSSKTERSGKSELKWYAPNGKTYYFCAHSVEMEGKNVSAFVDNTSTWRAAVKKNGFEIVSLRDGSSFTYEDGRLTEFMLKDKSAYTINYGRAGTMPLNVRSKSGKTAISFEYANDGRHVKGIRNFEGLYKFSYWQRKPGDIISDKGSYKDAVLLSDIVSPGEKNG